MQSDSMQFNKNCRIFVTFTDFFIGTWFYCIKTKNQEFSLVYQRFIRSPISLLYARSIGCVRVLYDILATVKAAPQECVLGTGQP